MIDQINLIIVIFFVAIALVTFIVLCLVLPNAVKDTSQIIQNNKMKQPMNVQDKSLSKLMEKLASASDYSAIEEILEILEEEMEKLENSTQSKIQLKQVSTIKKWSESFSIDTHINDIEEKGYSRQVQFDKKKKDFKLMIVRD